MESILACVKRILVQAVSGIVLIGITMYCYGLAELIVPVAVGSFVGAVCWFVAGFRILKSENLSAEEAKKKMVSGWISRLVLLLVTLVAAVHISEGFFWATVLGFFFFSSVAMINAMIYSYRN